MKLGLGTVQFGLDYGISNSAGVTLLPEVVNIIDIAHQNSIQVIDTAPLYGSSEDVLGKVLPDNHMFQIVTKTPRFDKEIFHQNDADQLEQIFSLSLKKLRVSSVYGLLIHNADDLLASGGQHLYDKMNKLKKKRLVRKIGVSVYYARQIDSILKHFAIDMIQIPVNVLDQRLLVSGHITELKSRGIEIHARSAFLQGLLLIETQKLPPRFNSIKEHLAKYHAVIRDQGISPVRAALGFLMRISAIDHIICGVNNAVQLTELCKAAIPVETVDYSCFALHDESILNPSAWGSEL